MTRGKRDGSVFGESDLSCSLQQKADDHSCDNAPSPVTLTHRRGKSSRSSTINVEASSPMSITKRRGRKSKSETVDPDQPRPKRKKTDEEEEEFVPETISDEDFLHPFDDESVVSVGELSSRSTRKSKKLVCSARSQR